MIWDTSIWRLGCLNRSKIHSAQKCYPCLRYVVSPMSPGRTLEEVVGSWGLKPQTSTVSIPRRRMHRPASRSSKLQQRIRLDRELGSLFTHGTASGRTCVFMHRSSWLRHKVRHNFWPLLSLDSEGTQSAKLSTSSVTSGCRAADLGSNRHLALP
jgi:hypothetical protein